MRARVQIASAPHPQGLIWIMNVLMELGIYCTFTTHGHWMDAERGEIRGSHFFTSDHAACLLPALTRLRGVPDAIPVTSPWVECGHMLPTAIHESIPTIVWYRDIHGALFSQWQRNREAEPTLSMDAFLQRELIVNGQTTGLGLSPQDYLSLYYFLWLHAAGPWAAFQFDDLKNAPLPGIQAILRFLGEVRSDARILAAVESSRVETIVKEHPKEARGFFRRGDPAEGTRCFPPECEPLLGPLPRLIRNNFLGTRSTRVDRLSWPELLEKITQVGKNGPRSDLLPTLEAADFHTVHAMCMTAEADDETTRLVLLALRWTSQLFDSPLSFQPQYTAPGWETTFKVIVFVLSLAGVPDLVRRAATREFQRRPSLLQTVEQLERDLQMLRTQLGERAR